MRESDQTTTLPQQFAQDSDALDTAQVTQPLTPSSGSETSGVDFFLSHYQATGGDQVMALELRLEQLGFVCWLDQKAASITKESMGLGVQSARVFLLFLSQGVLSRPFVLFEIKAALEQTKHIMLMHETDSRHGKPPG